MDCVEFALLDKPTQKFCINQLQETKRETRVNREKIINEGEHVVWLYCLWNFY